MKTVAELKEMIGVTRKTMRGYKEMGLLRPSNEPKGNEAWLYDDEAINRLQLILLLQEVGYKRSEIRDIFEEPEKYGSMDAVFQKALAELHKKKKRLDGMIFFLEQVIEPDERIESFVESVLSSNTNASNVLKNGNVGKTFDMLSSYSVDELRMLIDSLPFIESLINLAGMKKQDPDSLEVYEQVCKFTDEVLRNELIISEFPTLLSEEDDEEQKRLHCLQTLVPEVFDLRNDPANEDKIKALLGEEEYSFLKEALFYAWRRLIISVMDL